MTVKTRLEKLEKTHQAASGLAVVIVGRGETKDQTIARAGVNPACKLLILVNRHGVLTDDA